LSSLAIAPESPERLQGAPRAARLLRAADLAILAVALPLFLLLGWPLVGYAAAAVAWLAQRALQHFAAGRARAALGRGERRVALGAIAGATLGRVWIVTLAILVVGLAAEREDGLAAAVLSLVLVTAHLIGEAFGRLLDPEERS
jgi:hypothetical protein